MAIIRPFPNKQETANGRINSTLRRRIRVRITAVLAVILSVFIALFSYSQYEKNKEYTEMEVLSSIMWQQSAGSTILSFDDSLLSYSKDGAGSIDAKGNLLWNQTFDMQNPMCSVSNSTAAFADYGGSTVYIQRSNKSTAEVDTSMPIRKIAVSDAGIVAAVLEDTNVTWIYLYDMNGDTIAYFRTTMEKSGYPIDLALSPSGEVLAISYYYVDIEEVRSSVAFYNFGEVGQNSIDNYVSGYNYQNALVPLVSFLNNDYAYAVSGDRLSVYEGAHKPLSISENMLSEEILSVFDDDKYIGIVYRNSSSEHKYRLVVYSEKGEELSEKEFDFDYTSVEFGNNQYVLYGNTNLYIAKVTGAKRYEGEYTSNIKQVLCTQVPSKYAFVTDTSIDTVLLK